MKFNTDSYIEMGASHNICEDYALNGNFGNNFHYIIVCDGCSSSKHTDFGARILAHSCQRELLIAYNNSILDELDWQEAKEYLKNKIIHNAMTVVKNYGLSYEICDATLMYAFVLGDKVYYQVHGDGNVLIRKADKTYTWQNLTYESNAPFYLSYEMDVLRKHSYMDDSEFGGKEFYLRTVDFDTLNYTGRMEVTSPLERILSVHNIESITLSSDGIETYSHTHKRLTEYPSDAEKKSLKPESMVRRMTDYKSHNGEFVKRRMKKIKFECDKIQAEHFDDVSCATLWIDHGEES